MKCKVLILRKRRTTRQYVRDTFGRFSTESTKGVIKMIGLGLTCMIGLCRCLLFIKFKHPRNGLCRRRIPILKPCKATPLVQLVLLPSRCEKLSLPFLFLDFSFPLLHCSLFEVPLDLISGYICSICVVTALGVIFYILMAYKCK